MRGRMSTRLGAATAAVTNRFVASANMKVGAYTIANAAPAVAGARNVTVTHTQVGGVTDTLGTIVVVGKDLLGFTITETITPVDGNTATGTKWFASITSVTGAGWVVDTTADTIVVGHSAAAIVSVGGGSLASIVVNTTAAGAVTVADASGTLAVLKSSIAEDTYLFEIPYSGYLSVTLAAASDVTVVHTGSVPTTYALA
jgi:hypothetical protein